MRRRSTRPRFGRAARWFDSAWLGGVVGGSGAAASGLVVGGDGCGEAAGAGVGSFSEAGEGAGAVAVEGERARIAWRSRGWGRPSPGVEPISRRSPYNPGLCL